MIDPIPVNIEWTKDVPMLTYFFCFSFDSPPVNSLKRNNGCQITGHQVSLADVVELFLCLAHFC